MPTLAFAGPDAGSRVTLTLNVIGPGTVAASPGTRCVGYLTRVHTCRATYAAGTRVRLTALPNANGRLSSWRGVSGSGLTRTLTMNAARLVTATFVKKSAPSPPPPPPPPALGTRTNPVPLGQPVGIVSGDQRWTLRIVSTQPDGTAAVLAANQFNDPPAPGNQFFLAAVEVAYLSGTSTLSAGFNASFYLRTVGNANVVYTTFGNSCGVIPGEIEGSLLPGGTTGGNVCWSVPSAEAGSLIAFIALDNKPYYIALR